MLLDAKIAVSWLVKYRIWEVTVGEQASNVNLASQVFHVVQPPI